MSSQGQPAAKMHDGEYTDAELASARPLTPRVVKKIRWQAGLMRWDDSSAVPGSLADEFWNKTMPRLLALAEKEAESNG